MASSGGRQRAVRARVRRARRAMLVAGAATVLVLTPVVEGLGAAASDAPVPERAGDMADQLIAAEVAEFVSSGPRAPR